MSVLTYKCPNCDGGLIFDPVTGKFVCEYCLSKYTEQELNELNPAAQDDSNAKEFDEKIENGGNPEQMDLVGYTCPSCGAEVVTDSTTAATFCYYCHNPVVLSGRLDGEFTPDMILPFAISKEDASSKFMTWAKKKWFVPSWFFSKKQIDTLTGVYFPHWIVDSDTRGTMDTEGYKTRTWRSGDTEYTEHKYYRVIRKADIHLEDVTRVALAKANKKLVEGIHPFDDKKLVPFNMGYLSGFQAEKRDVEREEFQNDVTSEINSLTQTLVCNTASEYLGITNSDANAEILVEEWEYALLPVWTLTYKANNNDIYYYSMNGDSGKLCGKLPIDFKRLAILFGIVTILAFILLMLGDYFIW